MRELCKAPRKGGEKDVKSPAVNVPFSLVGGSEQPFCLRVTAKMLGSPGWFNCGAGWGSGCLGARALLDDSPFSCRPLSLLRHALRGTG